MLLLAALAVVFAVPANFHSGDVWGEADSLVAVGKLTVGSFEIKHSVDPTRTVAVHYIPDGPGPFLVLIALHR